MKETRRRAFLASQPAAGKQPAGLPETCCAHFYCVPALSACISTMFKPFLCAVLLIPSTFLCAHFYCIPALSHAEKYPMLAHYACTSMRISIALPLFPAYYPLLFLFISSSTFLFVRSAFYCVFLLHFHSLRVLTLFLASSYLAS